MFVSKKWTVGLAILAGLAFLTACNKNLEPTVEPEPEPEPEPVTATVSAVTVGETTATLSVSTSGFESSSYAYAAYVAAAAPEVPEPSVLFRDGTTGSLTDGSATITLTDLLGQTDYTVYVAFTSGADSYYADVVTCNFTTNSYSEDLTVAATYSDGFDVWVKVPDEVVEAGHVVRYGGMPLPQYNTYKQNGWPDAELLTYDGGLGMYLSESGHVIWRDEGMTFVDENGDQQYIHNPITPGEPTVFFVAEFGLCLWPTEVDGYWVDSEQYRDPMFDMEGFQEAYWTTGVFPDEAEYWTGYYNKIEFVVMPPAKMDAAVKVEADMGAVTGTIRLTPDEGVLTSFYVLCDDTFYAQVLSMLGLCNFVYDPWMGATEEDIAAAIAEGESNENYGPYVQWFLTSYYAYTQAGVSNFSGPMEFSIRDYFYNVEADTDYHLLITSIGDEDMMTQSFQHEIISTTPYTGMAAPEVTVTPLEVNPETGEPDPFNAWFNIKNTGDVEVYTASYACNYVRDWEAMLNGYYTYNSILEYYGNEFSAAEVAAINSADGYNFGISSIDGMTTRIAVRAGNIEFIFNDLNVEGCPAIADVTTPTVPDAERVESALFDELPGDWTLTADAFSISYDYDDNWNQIEVRTDQTISKKVTIYNGIHDYPETLPESVYAVYEEAGLTREEADNYYDEFKMEAEAYNAKVRGQNRLLVLGYGGENSSAYYKAYTPYTPYELFCSDSYNAYNVPSLFYDFGPKWYLQVAEDGSVTAPFNASTMYPLANHNGSYTYYMVAFSSDANQTMVSEGAFDVTVSDDHATLTVEPMEDANGTLYPNAAYVSYGNINIAGYETCSALTLTKGYSEAASQSSVGVNASDKAKYVDYKLPPIYRIENSTVPTKPRTSFVGTMPEYQKAEISIMTSETFSKKLESSIPKYERK